MSIQHVAKHHNNILRDAKESIEEAIRCVKHAKDYRWGDFYPYDTIIGHCEAVIRQISELLEKEEE